MKKIISGLLCMLFLFKCHARENPVSINVGAKRCAKMKLLLVSIGGNEQLKECVATMQNDFAFSGQFDVAVSYCEKLPSKNMLQEWSKQGYILTVFLNASDDDTTCDWRIYDTRKMKMLKGMRYKKRGILARGWGHNMADMIWPLLIGQESSFSSKLAFCKEVRGKNKYPARHIYISDFDGSFQEPVVQTPTVNLAPRWNKDLSNPLLFYSESSQSNISLRVASMDGRRKIASDFEGLNMLPAFSKDGKEVVYCVSNGAGQCHLFYYKNGQLHQLTHNKGNNISPTLSDDGNQIYFCSDFSGCPLIYCLDRTINKLEKITPTGPCFSPSFCQKNNKVAYIKRVDGVMQIFVYDVLKKEHKQLTADTQYHKEDCAWSACGNYLLFSVNADRTSMLAIEHINTHQRHILTASNTHCSYPAWSPLYHYFPHVRK